MNHKFIIFSCLTILLLVLAGCTENGVIVPPFTLAQLLAKGVDVNGNPLTYAGYLDGNYDGLCFQVFDVNHFGLKDCMSVDANIPWSQLINFPVGCGAGEVVKIVGSSLVCVLQTIDTNTQTAGWTSASGVYLVDLNMGGKSVFGVRDLNGVNAYLTGKVGIGTTAPGIYNSKLDVVTGATASNALAIRTTDAVQGTTGTVLYLGVGATTGNTYGVIRTLNVGGTGGANLVLNPTAGNVGIGTTAPTETLHVVGDTRINSGGDYALPALGANGGALKITTAGTRGLLAGNLAGGNFFMQVQRLDGTATAYNLLLQPNGGNVGIGTTNPATKLDVRAANGLTDTWGNINVITTDATAINKGGSIGFGGENGQVTTPYLFGKIAGRAEAANNYAGYLSFATSLTTTGVLTERMRITSTGNVGIGTTAPATKIHAYSTNYNLITSEGNGGSDYVEGAFYAKSNASTRGAGMFTTNVVDTKTWFIGQPYASTAKFAINYAPSAFSTAAADIANAKFVINGVTGAVGIGTNSPSYKLDVNSGASIGIYVDSNVSAAGYITRTNVYDKSLGSALSKIKDASTYIKNGKIDHNAFDYSKVNYDKTVPDKIVTTKEDRNVLDKTITRYWDLNGKELTEKEATEPKDVNNPIEFTTTIEEIYKTIKVDVNTQTYKVIQEEGVSLDKELALIKQALFELKDCINKSKDFAEYKNCIK